MTKYKSLFGYYGGKSKIAALYPLPTHGMICEPFAGSAAYSLLHHERQVFLSDSDTIVSAIWNWCLSRDALDEAHRFIRPDVSIGDKVTDIAGPDCPVGLLRFMQSTANAGTQGAKGIHNQITKLGIKSWHLQLPKLEHWLPRIRHWQFFNWDYTGWDKIIVPPATWFVDPPYANAAGRRYRQQITDYTALGEWCRRRSGQVIVCENEGATWLPFEPLVARRGIFSSYQKSRAMEVMCLMQNPC